MRRVDAVTAPRQRDRRHDEAAGRAPSARRRGCPRPSPPPACREAGCALLARTPRRRRLFPTSSTPTRDGAARPGSAGCEATSRFSVVEPPVGPAGERRPDLAPAATDSGRRSPRPASACPCFRSSAARVRSRASRSCRTPNSNQSGGMPFRGFDTAPGVVVCSPRVWSSVMPTVPATARLQPPRRSRAHAPEGSSRASLARRTTAILLKVMPNYRDLLQQVKGEIEEVDATRARSSSTPRRSSSTSASEDEWSEGHIPGAVHVPRGFLESRIEHAAPDRSQPVVVYCAGGSARRSRRRRSRSSATRTSSRSPAATPTGSATASRRSFPRTLDAEKRSRYSRHLLIPEVGVEGQLKLLDGARPPDRRRRPRHPGQPLSRRRRRRHASASSTTTASTRRTCSARSRTRPRRSATGRRTPPSARSRRSTPMSRS